MQRYAFTFFMVTGNVHVNENGAVIVSGVEESL